MSTIFLSPFKLSGGQAWKQKTVKGRLTVASLGIIQVLAVLVGAVIAGEALVLLVGMVFLSPRPNPWLTYKNLSNLILDLVCGTGLIGFALTGRGASRNEMLLFFALITLGFNAYREWEYLAKRRPRFLSTFPLFVFNNIKLLFILVVGGLAFSNLLMQ